MSASSIANMLVKIVNAQRSFHKEVILSHSKFKVSILEVLKKEGFILSFDVISGARIDLYLISVSLKYYDAYPVISSMKLVSKPSLKNYVSVADIPKVSGGLGLVILSTSKGVLSGVSARKLGVGGEVLCSVY